jgi:hypothetical protein
MAREARRDQSTDEPAEQAAKNVAAAGADAAERELSALELPPELMIEAEQLVEKRERIAAFLEKAEAARQDVSTAIYERVSRDYSSQLRALAGEYAPVRERIVSELRRIRSLETELRSQLGSIQEELEELRFRCRVGELTEGELAENEQAKTESIEDLSARLKTIEATFEKAGSLLGEDVEKALERQTGVGSGAVEVVSPPTPATEDDSELDTEAPPDATVAVSPSRLAQLRAELQEAATTPPPASTGTTGATGVASPLSSAVDSQPPSAASPVAPLTAERTVVMGRRAFLRLATEGGEEVFLLGEGPLTLGRSPRNNVVLSAQTVSRKHAVIDAKDGKFIVDDVSSGGGILVNGERVTSAVLQNGDEIKVGPFLLRYEGP